LAQAAKVTSLTPISLATAAIARPGVDDETPGLRVLDEGVVEARCGVLGLDDDRLHVVGDDDGEDPAEVAPGRLEASDDFFGAL